MSLASFIPEHISNETVLAFYQMFTWIRVPGFIRKKNYIYNLKHLGDMWAGARMNQTPYIENQAQWSGIRFGAGRHHCMSYSGCEIIAVFNAWRALRGPGTPGEMADLIREFEHAGAALWGAFGTSPRALIKYFRKCGLSVLVSYGENDSMKRIERESRAMIATVYNDGKDITRQIHTVCITGDRKQGFVLHNAYKRDKNGVYCASVPYGTLGEAVAHISEYELRLICLIGISEGQP